MMSECLYETSRNDERRFIGKQKKKENTHIGKMDKFGLLLAKFSQLYTSRFILGFFSFDIFYVSTFWKVLCPFFNDNVCEMWLQYFWWNFGGSTIIHVIS